MASESIAHSGSRNNLLLNNLFSAAHRHKDLIALDVLLFAIFFGIISFGYYLDMLCVGWCNPGICAVHKKGHNYFCRCIPRLSKM